jgi:hypothetical protein
LLSVIGGVLGLPFARWGTQGFLALMSRGENQMILDVKPDWRVLLFTLAASVLTGILFGLAPALRAVRVELAPAMKESAGNISEGRRGHFLGESLVVNLLTFGVDPTRAGYKGRPAGDFLSAAFGARASAPGSPISNVDRIHSPIGLVQ